MAQSEVKISKISIYAEDYPSHVIGWAERELILNEITFQHITYDKSVKKDASADIKLNILDSKLKHGQLIVFCGSKLTASWLRLTMDHIAIKGIDFKLKCTPTISTATLPTFNLYYTGEIEFDDLKEALAYKYNFQSNTWYHLNTTKLVRSGHRRFIFLGNDALKKEVCATKEKELSLQHLALPRKMKLRYVSAEEETDPNDGKPECSLFFHSKPKKPLCIFLSFKIKKKMKKPMKISDCKRRKDVKRHRMHYRGTSSKSCWPRRDKRRPLDPKKSKLRSNHHNQKISELIQPQHEIQTPFECLIETIHYIITSKLINPKEKLLMILNYSTNNHDIILNSHAKLSIKPETFPSKTKKTKNTKNYTNVKSERKKIKKISIIKTKTHLINLEDQMMVMCCQTTQIMKSQLHSNLKCCSKAIRNVGCDTIRFKSRKAGKFDKQLPLWLTKYIPQTTEKTSSTNQQKILNI